MAYRWLVLMVSLPPHPSSLRVRTWRRLRALGAVALKKSAYLLPAGPERHEQFQWLAQEVQRAGGEATLMQVERIESLTDEQVIRVFREARDAEYLPLARRYRGFLRTLERRSAARPVGQLEDEAARLAREAERIGSIDFYGGAGRDEIDRLRETVERRLRPSPASEPTPALAGLRGRCWVTRPRPHVDRIASAWLIKRFVDPEATFLFAAPEAFPPDAIPFDAVGVALGHQGSDCTFETILRQTGLTDPALRAVAEIVHEADLRDGAFPRPEAAGLDLVLRGLLSVTEDDQAVLAAGLTLFDGIHAVLDARPGSTQRGPR